MTADKYKVMAKKVINFLEKAGNFLSNFLTPWVNAILKLWFPGLVAVLSIILLSGLFGLNQITEIYRAFALSSALFVQNPLEYSSILFGFICSFISVFFLSISFAILFMDLDVKRKTNADAEKEITPIKISIWSQQEIGLIENQ